MANSDRKIIRGVRVKTTTYVAGMEDELDKVLPSSDITRLTAKGYIEGKWTGKNAAAVKTESPDAEDLSTLKKDDLLTKAESLGVVVDSSLTKAEIIEAIEGRKE